MKAQTEHHLGFIYADLCLKLSNTPIENMDEGAGKGKVFKKMLLERCQKEFEQDQEALIAEIEKLDEEDKALKVTPYSQHNLRDR